MNPTKGDRGENRGPEYPEEKGKKSGVKLDRRKNSWEYAVRESGGRSYSNPLIGGGVNKRLPKNAGPVNRVCSWCL